MGKQLTVGGALITNPEVIVAYDQESIDLGQLNIRSYGVPILGGPLIALVLMEKFDLKFAVKWFFRFSIMALMPGGCVRRGANL